MSLTFTFASATARFGEAQSLNLFEIVLIGFSFVFCILLALYLITSIIGKVFALIPAEASPGLVGVGTAITTAPEKSLTSSKDVADDFDIDESDPHYIAVIAAAVHCAMAGRKHKIISIRSSDSNWAAEGRRQIFSSRKVR